LLISPSSAVARSMQARRQSPGAKWICVN